MSYQELQNKVGELRNLAQGDDSIAVRNLRIGAMELHSALPLSSQYVKLIEQVLVVTKEGVVSQRLLRARQVLSWLQNDMAENASYLAEKQVSREDDGSIIYA